MVPTIGNWYNIRYSKKTSKCGFHGIAKCIKGPFRKPTRIGSDLETDYYWIFKHPDYPRMDFEAKDVKSEYNGELPLSKDEKIELLKQLVQDAYYEAYSDFSDIWKYSDSKKELDRIFA